MARKWIWLSIVLVIAGGIGFFLFKGGPGQARSDTNPIEAAEKAGETELQQQREALKLAVIGADGQLHEARHVSDGWIIGIELKATTLHRTNMMKDALTLFEELDRTNVPIEQVTVDFRSNELKDVYGHQLHDVAVMKIRLERPTFRRINWHGFETDNFERVADEFWVHEEVLKREQSGQQGGQGGVGGGGAGGGGNGG